MRFELIRFRWTRCSRSPRFVESFDVFARENYSKIEIPKFRNSLGGKKKNKIKLCLFGTDSAEFTSSGCAVNKDKTRVNFHNSTNRVG